MLRLAVVTPNPIAADAIEMLTMESGAFLPCHKVTPVPHPKEVIRTLAPQEPALVLLDLGDWIEAAAIARELNLNLPRTVQCQVLLETYTLRYWELQCSHV